jgi:hypothetical protein
MGTHNALYFRGDLPADYRPSVEGPCPVRQVGTWTQLSLPGVDDGEASARELSQRVAGKVIWAIVQTTASYVGVVHFGCGNVLRRIEFGDGAWLRVEGEPEPWEGWLFSPEELELALETCAPGDEFEFETAFAEEKLAAGRSLPWPREWETVRAALGLTKAEWDAGFDAPVLATVEGKATSKLTHGARIGWALTLASLVGLWLTRDGGFAGLAVFFALATLGAGFLRRAALGRWLF